MKKFISILTALLLIFTFSACSSAPAATDKTAAQLAQIVQNSIEFPQLVEVTDKDDIAENIGIDLSQVTDFVVFQQMLSVDVSEIIILIVKDGAESQLKTALENRKQSLIDDFAFYPNQVASAEATVVGSEKNVVYLICHEEAATAEQALLQEI